MGEGGFILIAIAFVLYFTPSGIAHDRKHPQQGSVILLNVLLGWTVIGWIVALIWAFVGKPEPKKD